jgi:hypothetical protein
MGHIFISYSHKDTDYAHGLANNLQSIGLEVWIDARLDYGSQWPHEIQKQLDSCDAFIIIMTPRAFDSEWVQSELQRAKRKLKPIFPVLLEGDEPWLSIESTQFYDVRGGRFPDDKFYSALKRAVSTGQNTSTLLRFKKFITNEPTVSPSASKNRTGILIAIIGAVGIICAVCAIMFVGLFGSTINKKLFSVPEVGNSLPLTATLAPFSANQPIPSVFLTLLPTEILYPTLSPSSIPTFPPSPTPTFPPPPTDAPIVVTNNYEYTRDCGGVAGRQRWESLDYVREVRTVDLLQVEVSIPLSDNEIVFHILLDDVEVYTTARLGLVRSTSGSIDLSPYVSPGAHKLTISPEGILGGGNVGTLWVYGATLHVETNLYP